MSKCHNLSENAANFLRGVELTGLLTCTGGKLRNHIFISITENINLGSLVSTKVNAVERGEYTADEIVLIIGSLAKFRRCQINIREKTSEILLALLTKSAVLDAFQ